jgi:hypothetical protein
MWLVSGMVMAVIGEGQQSRPAASLDLAQATMSPAAFQAQLPGVQRLELIRLGEETVYRAATSEGSRLINAQTGSPVVITDSLARIVARQESGVEQVKGSDQVKRKGTVTGYQVRFSDPRGTVAQVSAADASVKLMDSRKRLKATFGGLHTFTFLRNAGLERRSITFWVLLTSVFTLASVLTGYVMALPRRGRGLVE